MDSDRWDELLNLEEHRWAAICKVSVARGSGKGGQKRNKTSNAIRISCAGLDARESRYRSKEANLTSATRKLRLKIALHLSESRKADPPTKKFLERFRPYVCGGIQINPKNEDFPLLIANLIDLFLVHRAWHPVAEEVGVTVSGLKKFTTANPLLLETLRKILVPSEPEK